MRACSETSSITTTIIFKALTSETGRGLRVMSEKKKKRLRWFLLLSTMLDPRTILRDNMTSFTANLLF